MSPIRYIAQFHKGGFPELYVVMEVSSPTERRQIGEPKLYHDALQEAHERNEGTFGKPKPEDVAALYAWTLPVPAAP